MVTSSQFHLDNLNGSDNFFQVRGSMHSPLFVYTYGTPMLPMEFDIILKCLLEFCGLSTKVFKGHSFSIGAATSAALRG